MAAVMIQQSDFASTVWVDAQSRKLVYCDDDSFELTNAVSVYQFKKEEL